MTDENETGDTVEVEAAQVPIAQVRALQSDLSLASALLSRHGDRGMASNLQEHAQNLNEQTGISNQVPENPEEIPEPSNEE